MGYQNTKNAKANFSKGGGGGLKMKIYALEPNSNKFCIQNQWTTRRLKMHKLTAQNGGMEKNENLGPCTKLNQKCMVKSTGWPPQNVSIYFYI